MAKRFISVELSVCGKLRWFERVLSWGLLCLEAWSAAVSETPSDVGWSSGRLSLPHRRRSCAVRSSLRAPWKFDSPFFAPGYAYTWAEDDRQRPTGHKGWINLVVGLSGKDGESSGHELVHPAGEVR